MAQNRGRARDPPGRQGPRHRRAGRPIRRHVTDSDAGRLGFGPCEPDAGSGGRNRLRPLRFEPARDSWKQPAGCANGRGSHWGSGGFPMTQNIGPIGSGNTPDVGADAPQKHPHLRGIHLGPAKGLSKGRLARLRLRTVHDLDKRTRSYKRAMAVVDELTAAMGGPDAITLAQRHAIEHAGMLASIADDLTARAIAGMSANLDEARRPGNAARRARAAVPANRPDPKPQERRGLALARQRWADQAATTKEG